MSTPQYETFEAYGPYTAPGAHGASGAHGAHGTQGAPGAQGMPGAHGAPGTHGVPGAPGTRGVPSAPGTHGTYRAPGVHDAETLAYATPYGNDTYRPAYEAAAGAAPGRAGEPALPRQGGGRMPEGGAPGADGREAVGRRAGRRRKTRYGTRSESAVRRLLPQALVVAFLAGGTTAFLAKDKAIELTVDGRPRTLHTFADDVTELLTEEGVPVGAHDVVAPAPGTALASGDEVAVRYGRPVRLTLDGERREVWTTAHTVQGALDQLGVRAEGAYLSASRSRNIGRAGLALDVRTERTVTILADGRTRTIRTNAATVREAVEEAGISLHGQDTTSTPLDGFPRDGQTVTVLRVTGSREVREEVIPFEVRRTADPTLFKGTEVIEQAGRPGLRRVTYYLRTVNGVRQKPRRQTSELVREPRTQLVMVGTKPHPDSVKGADGLNWHGLAACESGGRPHAVDASGTYGGLYQFDSRTWHSLGGSGRPQDAPAEEQTFRAKKLYLSRGSTPWPHCGARLHR
ncbi:ubiquitin-like domain-containing protein [Streptomyces sp. NPDC051016]|uniref:ubiquitin-like domain-containing protein n=1 Tax=Streptomyces sp. NPDC051016 TaxID=3365638 RepID=UPI0037879B43